MNKFLLFLLLVTAAKMTGQVSITPIADQCVNNPLIRLSGSPLGGTWIGQGITNTNTGDFSPSLAGVGARIVKYFVNGDSAFTVITVNPIPVVSFDANLGLRLCKNKPDFILTGGSPLGGVYGGLGVTLSPNFSPSILNTGNTKITYTYTHPTSGCSSSQVYNIYVAPFPSVDLGPDRSLCPGEPGINLDAGNGFDTYLWFGSASGTTRSTVANSVGTYGVVVTNWYGCKDSAIVKINGNNCLNTFTVKGIAFDDLNQNGTQENGEQALKNVPVYMQSNNYYSMTTTDQFGNYSLITFETGTTIVSIQLPYNSQLISPSSPAYHSVVISAMNDSVVGKDFAVHFLPDVHDVKVDLSTNLARPGFSTVCNAYVYNKGTVTEKNITLDLAYDNILTPSTSSIPYNNANNILTFAIDSIKAGESKLVSVSFNVPQGANHLGHQLDYFGDVSLTTNDVYLSDNKDTCLRIITGSYDPNMKESKLGEGNISPNTNEMEYTIHFQNTGTDTAFTVVVKDSLNKAVFDYKEVEMLCASHNYTYTIDTAGVIAFTFNNILLVDSTTNEPASHGFVKFKVKLNNGLSIGTVLKNKAYIYFDFNEPIITNEATNTLSNSVGVNEVSNLNFTVYPNPSNDKITLMGSSASLYSVELYDVLGKRVYAQSSLQHAHVVNVSSLEKGIYFVSILQDGKQQVEKVVVQ